MSKPNYKWESDFCIKTLQSNKTLITQVMNNNLYLLKQRKISQEQQIRDFTKLGLRVRIDYAKKLRFGQRVTCNISFLNFFANYWNLPLWKMMAEDFETLDKLAKS